MEKFYRKPQLHLTKHKRFVLRAHPNQAIIFKSAGLVLDLISYRG